MIGQNGKTMSNNHQSKNILLLDSSSSKNIIKELKEKKFFKIITFDFSSHKKLLNLKIDHEISDTYLDDLDLDDIQKKSYEYSKWSKPPEISKLLDYDGFNLGYFYYHEVFIFLLPFLKKFVELKKIHEKYQDNHFYSSGILDKLRELLEIPGSSIRDSVISEDFFNDSFEFQNNFLKIKFSRSNYLKIKNFLEKGINIFFKPRDAQIGKNILLVEFNSKQYSSIFTSLKNQNLVPVHYGRKRPAFWDYSSFSIIKNSGSSIITKNFLIDKSLKKKILTEKEHFIPNLIKEMQVSSFFQSFFSLNGISFWSIIRNSFLHLCEIRIKEAIEELELAKKLLKKTQPKSILIFSEIGYTEQFVMHHAKKLNIPIILLQHGVGAFDSSESDVINEFTGGLPIQSELYFSWGNATSLYAKAFGILESKIKIIGSPAHDLIFKNYKNLSSNKKEFVLLAAGTANHNNIRDLLVKTNDEYENDLRTICQVITNYDKKLIIKMHPYVDSYIETKIAKEFESNISIVKKGNILDLIGKSELMITLSVTSAILDAQILSVPVLRLPLKEWYGATNTHRHNPGYTVKLDQFEKIFDTLQKDIDFRNSVIDNGKQFVNDCLDNQGNATENIAKFLKQL